MAITFRIAGQDLTLGSDETLWLQGQVRASSELTPAAAAVSAKIEQALEEDGVIEMTLPEKRELIAALERGSRKPRSHDLRALEIGLHTAVYAETYLREQ